MVDFANPYSSLGDGIERGAGIAISVDKAKRERTDRERELSLKAADSKLELAKTMKSDKSRMMSLISSATEDYRKAGVDVPEFDSKAFINDDSSKELSDALNLWSKNTKSGTWDADFGRKWLITKGAEIGAKGQEFNALTEHAYKEALKPPKETGSVSPTDIKGTIMQKYLAGGEEALSPQERTLIGGDLQDPNLSRAAGIYFSNPMNMMKPEEEQIESIQTIAERLRSPGGATKELGSVIGQKYGEDIGNSFKEDVDKAKMFIVEGATVKEVVDKLTAKYKSYPDLIKAIKGATQNELQDLWDTEEGDTDNMTPDEIRKFRRGK